MKNLLHGLIIFTTIFSLPTSAKEKEISLGKVTIVSLSIEGSSRAAVVLRGVETPYIRLDCIDRSDKEGKRERNTILVFNKKTPIAQKNHQVFTGVQDFYCSGISLGLFAGLNVGDNVEFKLLIDSRIDDFRGGSEIVDIHDIRVVVDPSIVLPEEYSSKFRSYRDSGSIFTILTSREMLL